MMTKLNEQQIETINSNNGMRLYLESLLKGKAVTPRSWLYENMDADTVKEKWLEHLSSLEKGNEFESNVYRFDTSQLEKWGPQGEVAPIADLLDDVVLPTFESSTKPELFESKDWEDAKRRVIQRLKHYGVQSLRPASYPSVLDDMRARDTLESNSGWPDFTRRSKAEVKDNAVQAAMDGQWKTYPAIALFRNYNRKTRLVWMFPMSANLVEGSFFQPLQSRIMKANIPFFAPWAGFEHVRKLVTEAYASNLVLAASDFTSTDAHFTIHTSMEVFDVIKHCFQHQYWDALQESIEYMHNIPLVIGPDQMLTGEHGVSSGSNWTNFIETIFDWILSEYVSWNTEYSGLYAIGDDMSWVSSNYDPDFADQLSEIGQSVGQIIKAEKTTNDPGKVKSLQRLMQKGYNLQSGEVRAVYSTIRALKSSIYPERFHRSKDWSSDMFCARQFMILENCVDHPLFKDFVAFVCQGNRHLIPFAQKSSQELTKITRESKLLPGLNTTYNQERRDSSLSNFLSIRVAREL